jgi:hypothetical protein
MDTRIPHIHTLSLCICIYMHIYMDVCTGIYISVEGVYLTLCVYEYIYTSNNSVDILHIKRKVYISMFINYYYIHI